MTERVVRFRLRTIFAVLLIVIGVWAVLQLVWVARHILAWVFIALFLALALNPAVDWLQQRGVRNRGLATGVVYIAALGSIAAVSALFVPTLVSQINEFAQKVPDYVAQVTEGRGRLGFLQEKYGLVDKAREQLRGEGAASRLFGFSGTAVAVAKGVITAVVATVTIVFLTFFMLLEGRAWMERIYGLFSEESQPRWRAVGRDIYRTVGGYVTGNLLLSLIAGTAATILLLVLGVEFALALGLIVAILDLIPLAGATLAAIVVSGVAFLDEGWVKGLIVVAFFVVYQQLENHVLQPVVYGRTVQLSPLAVLIAVLIGAELAGILGALAAIPVAGTIQVLLVDYLRHRRAAVEPHTA